MTSAGGKVRIEHDSLGEVRVPADAAWGPQTQRAIENFRISGRRVDGRVIAHLARIKIAAARVNGARDDVGVDAETADAIERAAVEIVEGAWADAFPVDVLQTGSGTSTNMNVNEVIAHRAAQLLGRPVHPNDDVNASQSSNDVFPTAVRLAVSDAVESLRSAATTVIADLDRLAGETARVVKAGRTHMMDAAPVFLGDEFAGWAGQLRTAVSRLGSTLDELATVPLGGTAVGTGLNAPPGWVGAVRSELSSLTGRTLRAPADRFSAQAGQETLAATSGDLRVIAVALNKICNDLRLLASGPATGFGEIELPAIQPGSSIMPGKVNPVICESVIQVCLRVFGNDVTVGTAAASGQLELNTTMPLMSWSLLESCDLITAACRALDERCLKGIRANVDRCADLASRSPAVITGVAPVIGYELAARAATDMLRRGVTPKEALLAVGVDPAVVDSLAEHLDPSRLAHVTGDLT